MKVHIVFGTRPEAIKMASLINELKKDKYFRVKVIVTAQHREMLDQVLSLFDIVPDYDLNLMKKNQHLNELASELLKKINPILQKDSPDLLLVHGDTTTTLATTMAAFHNQIKIGHIEAGLRTFNMSSPWPEEANRQIVSKLSSLHFCPTRLNKENLINENIDEKYLIVTGNTVIDSMLHINKKISTSKSLERRIKTNLKKNNITQEVLDKNYVLITCHRRENFGKNIKNICSALKETARENKSMNFVYPVHPNPNIFDIVHNELCGIDNIFLLKPLSYEEFIFLMKNAYLVFTDSGGIQEEAPAFAKPVLVARETTERVEAVDSGTVRLVGTSKSEIKKKLSNLITNKEDYMKMSKAVNPYGDGLASSRIRSFLKSKRISSFIHEI